MAYVYILTSLKDNKRYIGSTINLERRLKEHANGLVESTKNRRPLILKHYQRFETLTEARVTEVRYKKSLGAYTKAIKEGMLKKA